MMCYAANTASCQANEQESYKCTCQNGWTGKICNVESKAGSGINKLEQGSSSSNDGLGVGAIVGIIFALLIIAVVIVGVLLFQKERNAKNAATRSKLGSNAYASATMSPPMFCRGRKLKAYPYYDPAATQSSAHQQLSNATAGSFIVSDAPQGNFTLYYKDANMNVSEATILAVEPKSNGSRNKKHVTLAGFGNQGTFPVLPMLVEHYASDMDVNAPIKLTVAKKYYFGQSMYMDSAI